MSGSSPGWALNYVPTPTEWNGAFAVKVDGANGTANNLNLSGAPIATTLQTSTSYANDTAAAAGGVAVWTALS